MSVDFTAKNARLFEATSTAKLRYLARKEAELAREKREAVEGRPVLRTEESNSDSRSADAPSAARLLPVRAPGAVLCNMPLGAEWCNYLERYVDHNDRLWKGRAYVREGRVIDLRITPGVIRGQVRGTKLYQVAIMVAPLAKPLWVSMLTESTAASDSLVELLQGRVSWPVMKPRGRRKTGLFPKAEDLHFSCTCEDPLPVCKHVAAVLYGTGVRLDKTPHALFKLRQVHARELLNQADALIPPSAALAQTSQVAAAAQDPRRIESTSDLADLFGIDFQS